MQCGKCVKSIKEVCDDTINDGSSVAGGSDNIICYGLSE